MKLGPKGERILRIAHKASLITGAFGLVWTMAIYNASIDSLPRSPNPATGNIYPLNAHGMGAYQTRAQRSHLDNVYHGSWALIVFGFVLGMIDQ
jgi:hypothetical protein